MTFPTAKTFTVLVSLGRLRRYSQEERQHCALNLKCMWTGGGYAVYAGKEVARALGLMSLQAEDCTAELDGLNEKQLETLGDWETKSKGKYPIVGQVLYSHTQDASPPQTS